ncbi:globin domain-containing protein [Sunxiuqinia elliptica]|uniref:Hemoglobin n=1 Tax=Sunxiuqinia elliptica TaxID=655355 RepID=A0A1I2BZX8_9BACT|nr:globin [Sunxiuqinia elliptica]SFE60870.1 hemoglobin [Sunxiuqinia elliptica]
MELKIERLPFGARPDKYMPDLELYKYLQEEGVRKMVSDHYDLLAQSSIKHLFPSNPVGLDAAKERSADFFVQRLGGPDYYKQHRGHPMLVRRHLPFKIDEDARIVWLECYRDVLLKLDAPEHLIMAFWRFLHDFSNWMVNTSDNPYPVIGVRK